jgi:predicted ATPase
MLKTLAISNYRSLRDFVMPLGPLNLITGPNGSGKSNVYRALRLLADTARGGVIASLAREGGISSTLWAGPESFSLSVKRRDRPVESTVRSKSVALRLGFQSEDFSYAIDLGLPVPSNSAFGRDPVIKSECIWHGPQLRPAAILVERRGPLARVRRQNGEWDIVSSNLQPFESMMDSIADPQRAAEVLSLRDQIRTWRFYDHFRTDAKAPARQLQIGTYTPVLTHDGRDLAAAMQTIKEIGDAPALANAISDAFPGSEIEISISEARMSGAAALRSGMRLWGKGSPLQTHRLPGSV